MFQKTSQRYEGGGSCVADIGQGEEGGEGRMWGDCEPTISQTLYVPPCADYTPCLALSYKVCVCGQRCHSLGVCRVLKSEKGALNYIKCLRACDLQINSLEGGVCKAAFSGFSIICLAQFVYMQRPTPHGFSFSPAIQHGLPACPLRISHTVCLPTNSAWLFFFFCLEVFLGSLATLWLWYCSHLHDTTFRHYF